MPDELQPRGRFFEKARQFWPGGFGGAKTKDWGKGKGIVLKQDVTNPERTKITALDKAAGWMLGIWVLVLGGFAMSFTVGAFVSAATLTYLIVREEEEFLEPMPLETPVGKADEPKPADKKESEKATEDKSEKVTEDKPKKKSEKKSAKKPEA